jgi:hypothetical protein
MIDARLAGVKDPQRERGGRTKTLFRKTAPAAAGEWFSLAKLMRIFAAAGTALVREDASLPSDNIYILQKKTP